MALTLHGTVADNTAVLSRQNAQPFIINGDFVVAQRGTSADGTSAYLIDRWKKQSATTGNVAVSQDTDAPTGFINSQKMLASGASSFFQTGQQIEYKNFYPLLGNSASLSFYYKSDVDVIIRIRTGTGTADSVVLFAGSVTSTATVSASADWVQYVHNFTLASNVTSLSIEFATGTLANTNFVYLAGVQLEQGTFDANSIPPFQHESFGENFHRCQRYLQKYLQPPLVGVANATQTVARASMPLQARMRTNPTASQVNGNFVWFNTNSHQPQSSGFSATYTDEDTFECDVTMTATGNTVPSICKVYQSGNAYLLLSAEL